MRCYDVELIREAEKRAKLLGCSETCDVYNHIMIYQIHSNHYGVLANPVAAAIYRSALELWLNGKAANVKEGLAIARISPVVCVTCNHFCGCEDSKEVRLAVAAPVVQIVTTAVQ